MRKEMKLITSCLAVVYLSLQIELNAQSRYQSDDVRVWQNGLVVLTSGDSASGSIAYHFREEVVEVTNEDQSISTFSPVNVAYFVVMNEYTGEQQLFRTLYWDQGKDYTDFKKPTFFEQLNEGKFTLIIREAYTQKNAGTMSDTGPYGREYESRSTVNGYFVNEVRPLYYILLPDGEIQTLRRVKKDLLRLCGNKSRMVKKYARKNKLSYEKPRELKAIINYYNTL